MSLKSEVWKKLQNGMFLIILAYFVLSIFVYIYKTAYIPLTLIRIFQHIKVYEYYRLILTETNNF